MSDLDLDAIEQRAKYEATTFSRESWRFDTVALIAEVRALHDRVAAGEAEIERATNESFVALHERNEARERAAMLEDGIEDLRERIIRGANELEQMADDLPQTEHNVRPHVRLRAKAEGLRVALDYARLLDISHDQDGRTPGTDAWRRQREGNWTDAPHDQERWQVTCPSCGDSYDKSDDARHDCAPHDQEADRE